MIVALINRDEQRDDYKFYAIQLQIILQLLNQ